MTTTLPQLTTESVHLHFDRGYSPRPQKFYQRLECRGWLDTLDWLLAESSDRLFELEERNGPALEIARERDILRMLEDEIREAEQQYSMLALNSQ